MHEYIYIYIYVTSKYSENIFVVNKTRCNY